MDLRTAREREARTEAGRGSVVLHVEIHHPVGDRGCSREDGIFNWRPFRACSSACQTKPIHPKRHVTSRVRLNSVGR